MSVLKDLNTSTADNFSLTARKLVLLLSICFLLVGPYISFAQCQPGDPDKDGDGICDALDICPNSPLNQDVDNDQICDAGVCDMANFYSL